MTGGRRVTTERPKWPFELPVQVACPNAPEQHPSELSHEERRQALVPVVGFARAGRLAVGVVHTVSRTLDRTCKDCDLIGS